MMTSLGGIVIPGTGRPGELGNHPALLAPFPSFNGENNARDSTVAGVEDETIPRSER